MLADPRVKALAEVVPPRPPGFCIGCPERPIFAAMKLVEQELGQHHVSADIGCHLFSILPPFNIGATTMGYGLGPASASAFNVPAGKRSISVLGDGGFWHNGLASSDRQRRVQQARRRHADRRQFLFRRRRAGRTFLRRARSIRGERPTTASSTPCAASARNGCARSTAPMTSRKLRDTLREALTTKAEGPKIIVASSECMLNKQRRVRPILIAKAIKGGRARGAREIRRRRGYLHRRSRLHPSLRLPLALGQADRRSVEGRSRSPRSTRIASDAEIAAKSPRRRRSVPRSIARRSSTIRLAGTAASPHLRAAVIGWLESAQKARPRRASPKKRREQRHRDPRTGTVVRAHLARHSRHGRTGRRRARRLDRLRLRNLKGWAAQSTSVPGVAQRTGATIYYIEMAPPKDGAEPVFALMPTPGDRRRA